MSATAWQLCMTPKLRPATKRKLPTYSPSTAPKPVHWGLTSTVRIAGKANSIEVGAGRHQRRAPLSLAGHNDRVEDYWTLDVELASEDEAEQAIELLQAALPEGNRVLYALDPRHVLTWHLDRASVDMIRAALAGHAETGGEVAGLLATCDEWLMAHPGDDD